MKKALAVTAMMVTLLGGFARAGELNLLLDKMVEKGQLTGGEAQEIRIGTQEEVKSEISRGMNMTMPLWMQVMKFKADFRLRYQYNHNERNAFNQHRGRYRVRFGADTLVTDRFNMSFGLASGSSVDSRSTNQTLTGNFSKKNVYIDYAYGEYTASDYLTFSGGRMKMPIWTPTDMAWDSDLNPEGVSAKVSYKADALKEYFVNSGFLVLNEDLGTRADPYIIFGQPGFTLASEDASFDMRAAAAYYDYAHVKHATPLANRPSTTDGYQLTNTTITASSVYKYGYDAIHPSLELNYTLLQPINIPLLGNISYLSVFGEYIKNISAPRGTGWIAGVRVGQRAVAEPGQWQLRYSIRRLEKNAVPDAYPDSDFYGGSTSVRGHRVTASVGLARNVTLDSNYFYTKSLENGKKEQLVQVDTNFKF
jgi:hypothetical protein